MDSKNDEHAKAADTGQTAAVATEKWEELVRTLLAPDDDRRHHNALVVRHMAREEVLKQVVDRLVEPFRGDSAEEQRRAATALIWIGARAVPRLATMLFRGPAPEFQIRLAALLEAMGPHLDAPPPVDDFLLLDLLAMGAENVRVREAVAKATRAVWRPGPYPGD